ncbi:MAG: hypothetical protein R6U66_10395 [Bacteroidales bacterium]
MNSVINISLPEDSHFSWTIRFDTSNTFEELHKYLQSILGYDSTELASFHLVDEQWDKLQEITLMDMQVDDGMPSFLMAEMNVEDYFNADRPKLLYTFDFLNNRSFQLEWLQHDEGESPALIAKEGKVPQQVNDDFSDLLEL